VQDIQAFAANVNAVRCGRVTTNPKRFLFNLDPPIVYEVPDDPVQVREGVEFARQAGIDILAYAAHRSDFNERTVYWNRGHPQRPRSAIGWITLEAWLAEAEAAVSVPLAAE